MIPPPPLTETGDLAVNRWDLLAGLVGGVLAVCCVCPHTSATHWGHERRYVALHERCVPHLMAEWRDLIESDQVTITAPSGPPLGAYARRQASAGPTGPRTVSAASVDLGSPYFIPGMAEGAPWVAVAAMPDGGRLVTPCGLNEAHAREVNRFRRASTAHGFAAGPRNLVPLGGYVVDPTGARSGEWDAAELNNREDSASLAV